jgi:hypothetical protein
MENNFQEEIKSILNVARLQRYYRHVENVTKRRDLLVGDPLSIGRLQNNSL